MNTAACEAIERSSATRDALWINSAVVIIATAVFVLTGSRVVPAALGLFAPGEVLHPGLTVAFLLNIALLLFGWRRSVELKRSFVAQKEAEARANRLAFLDDTTGLFNRRFLIERLAEMRDDISGVTLLLVDLDHFKNVNDLYGHAVGDSLLREVAARIRSVSPDRACCARLGGDEFAILVQGDDAREQEATRLAEALLQELNKPIHLEGTIAIARASIGLSKPSREWNRAEELLRRSDIAMYEAKTRGRNCFVWFDAAMEQEVNRRTRLENELRHGLTESQFVPYFQPQIDLETGDLTGFEVLARWKHPTRGIVEPTEFIPMAEATGLISELSMSVMREALIHARNWPILTISVNISPVQFKDPLLAQRIVQVLLETGCPPNRLELELTESAILEDRDLAVATVESLKNHGIRISLDDFGTGYASLTQLRSLPFDRIKIDRSFVSSLMDDEPSNAIVHAIATLGRNLNLPITAEGVETEIVHQRLRLLGCSDAQGWLFGKALPPEQAIMMLPDALSNVQSHSEGVSTVSGPPLVAERRSYSRRTARR
jgi:diguanylate cyclase (GGDEF)-like protein